MNALEQGKAERRPRESAARTLVRRDLMIRLTLLGIVLTLLVFAGVLTGSERQVMDGVRRQARSIVDLIVTVRAWNASYGGVWVRKSGGAVTNPYLRELGVEPDMRTEDGDELTLRNPALMTREISELLSTRGEATFRLTSLDPVNALNMPDTWEREQLSRFGQDATPGEGVFGVGDDRVFRYIVPLYADETCLSCHAVRGDRVGDVRGAVSASVPLGDVDAQRVRDVALLLVIVLVGGGVFMLAVDNFTRRTARRLEDAQAELEHLATTDALTGLWNRRYVMGRLAAEAERSTRTGRPYGVLVIDVDHFKDVNDQHGHACGDDVLCEVAVRLHDVLRGYDLIGRIGGEEFLVVLPEAGESELRAAAERVCDSMRAKRFVCGDSSFALTVSIGGAVAQQREEYGQVVMRADTAMYLSKQQGRDRATLSPPTAQDGGRSDWYPLH